MIKRHWIAGLIVLLILALGAAYLFFTQNGNDSEQIRIELLEDALAPQTAEEGPNDWAEAIKTRNGAWQYALMNDELRQEHLKEFEELNWVTGFSSPWVENYEVSKESEDEAGNVKFKVKFDWYTSAGYAYTNYATLVMSKVGDEPNLKWLISYLDFNYETEDKP